MTEKIDIIYELFKDLSRELREKDKLIRVLQSQISAHDVELGGKVSEEAFNELCLKVKEISVKSRLYSALIGFIASAVFLTIVEIIWYYIEKGG